MPQLLLHCAKVICRGATFLPLKSVQRLPAKQREFQSFWFNWLETRVPHNRQRAHAMEKRTRFKIDAYNPPDTGRRKSYYTSVKVITCLRNGAVLGNVRAPRRVASARRSTAPLLLPSPPPSARRCPIETNESFIVSPLCRWISLPFARFSLDLALFAIASPSLSPARRPCFRGTEILFQVLLHTVTRVS